MPKAPRSIPSASRICLPATAGAERDRHREGDLADVLGPPLGLSRGHRLEEDAAGDRVGDDQHRDDRLHVEIDAAVHLGSTTDPTG
jgi:hypothetical protein